MADVMNISNGKIQAIKALRTFTFDTFGVDLGLHEAKDLIDKLLDRQISYFQRLAYMDTLINNLRECPERELEVALAKLGFVRTYDHSR